MTTYYRDVLSLFQQTLDYLSPTSAASVLSSLPSLTHIDKLISLFSSLHGKRISLLQNLTRLTSTVNSETKDPLSRQNPNQSLPIAVLPVVLQQPLLARLTQLIRAVFVKLQSSFLERATHLLLPLLSVSVSGPGSLSVFREASEVGGDDIDMTTKDLRELVQALAELWRVLCLEQWYSSKLLNPTALQTLITPQENKTGLGSESGLSTVEKVEILPKHWSVSSLLVFLSLFPLSLSFFCLSLSCSPRSPFLSFRFLALFSLFFMT